MEEIRAISHCFIGVTSRCLGDLSFSALAGVVLRIMGIAWLSEHEHEFDV
jgi:hypothetical protein